MTVKIISIPSKPTRAPTKSVLRFVGVVHAGKTVGFQNPSEEETSETMDLNDLLLVNIDIAAAALFRLQGDSMIEDGLFDNDILLVERTDKWRLGEIVIAEIDGEVTVKRIRRDRAGKLFLRAANEAIADLYPSEYLKVIAVVRNAIRCYAQRA